MNLSLIRCCGASLQMCLAILAAPLQAKADGFVNPLDAPAGMSALASQRVLLGVQRAGQRLTAVGQRGHIVYSDDDGANWIQAPVPVRVDLTALHFVSETKGWAVGQGAVVLHTEDAGKTWIRQTDARELNNLVLSDLERKKASGGESEQLATLIKEARRTVDDGPDKPLLDVWFSDEKNGFVVGAYNLIFRTSDGGKTWVSWFDRTDNPGLLHLTAVRGDAQRVYLVGERGLVLRLDAAQERFVKVPVELGYTGSLFALALLPGQVNVFGMRGSAFQFSEADSSWRKLSVPAGGGLNSATVLPDGKIVVVSQDGKVLLSGPRGADPYVLVQGSRPSVFTGAASAGAGRILVSSVQGLQVIRLP